MRNCFPLLVLSMCVLFTYILNTSGSNLTRKGSIGVKLYSGSTETQSS